MITPQDVDRPAVNGADGDVEIPRSLRNSQGAAEQQHQVEVKPPGKRGETTIGRGST